MSKKLKFFAMMLTCILLSINQMWATPKATYTWTANPGTEKDYFSSTSGNVTLGSYTWAYTQGSAETNYNSSGYIQLGAKNYSVGAFSLTLANTDPVKSVTVDCASYSGSSSISISIGGTPYLASTATPTWSNNSGGTRGGNELATPLTGNVAINFTASSRALYIKSITIVYGEAGGSTKTLHFPSHKSGHSFLPNLSFSLCQCSSCNFFKCLTVALFFHCILYFILFTIYTHIYAQKTVTPSIVELPFYNTCWLVAN